MLYQMIYKPLRYIRNVTGYGKKIPSGYMVYYNKRYYRVYFCCYSNHGIPYITIKGIDYIVTFECIDKYCTIRPWIADKKSTLL